jgi:hypothetical protein
MQGETIRKKEYFIGKRWAIGIRDIGVEELKYNPSGIMVSKLFKFNGVVDRVALEANTVIPNTFTLGSGQWVKYYVSPDDGITWVPISNIYDSVMGVKEIVAFNDPLPSEFREENITYKNVNNLVTSLRVKIEMSRPEELVSSSPVVRWYKLKVRLR